MNIVQETHTAVVVEELHHNPPHPQYAAPHGNLHYNDPSAPPPPPPPPPPPLSTVSVVNTNVYLNSGEYVTGYAIIPPPPPPPPPPPSLPCGIGVGWFLFILGWFLCAIPWYVGAIIIACSKVDPRERPGYIACSIFAIIITIIVIITSATGK